MATQEQVIIDKNNATQAKIDDALAETYAYLLELEDASEATIAMPDPTLDFYTLPATLSAYTTDVTADFDSGLAYPSAADMLDSSQTDGYDSAFLEYLEQQSRNNPTASWAAAVNAIRELYRDAALVSANAFAATILPSLGNLGNTFATPMQAQVTDAQAVHEIDFGLTWRAVANDIRIDFQRQAHLSGTSIEEVRASIVRDMISIQTDYNNAVLDKARTDFLSIQSTVEHIRGRTSARIKAHHLVATQAYEVSALDQRTRLLTLDKELTEQRDLARRTRLSYQLELSKAAALANYSQQIVAQLVISTGTDSVFTTSGDA